MARTSSVRVELQEFGEMQVGLSKEHIENGLDEI